MNTNSSKAVVRIEDWELALGVLWGKVQDHPRFDKNESVKTSRILKKPRSPKQGDKIETMNTIYILGKKL